MSKRATANEGNAPFKYPKSDKYITIFSPPDKVLDAEVKLIMDLLRWQGILFIYHDQGEDMKKYYRGSHPAIVIPAGHRRPASAEEVRHGFWELVSWLNVSGLAHVG